ncbi:BRO family protein [Citrobacter freundii]|nr:BRO family protein [Citrobacter freundii]
MSQQPLEVLNQTFESRAVRVVMKDGDPWFIAKDVAEALGYKKPENAVAQHCEEAVNLPPVSGDSLDSRLKIIPESDVYALIFGSKLESAKRFRRWVAKEVLPSIRRSGGYIQGEETLSADDRKLLDELKQADHLAILSGATILLSKQRSKAATARLYAVLRTVTLQSVREGERFCDTLTRVCCGQVFLDTPIRW